MLPVKNTYVYVYSYKHDGSLHRTWTKGFVLDANEDVMRDMATREANINKEAVETTARAIRDGFVGDSIYCKYCGSKIDEDSKFCKKCGKEM